MSCFEIHGGLFYWLSFVPFEYMLILTPYPVPAAFRALVPPPPAPFAAHGINHALAVSFFPSTYSLPVDSELSACYSWEAREYSKKEKAERKLREQRAKLKLLGAGRQWEGAMRVRDRAGDPWESRWGIWF